MERNGWVLRAGYHYRKEESVLRCEIGRHGNRNSPLTSLPKRDAGWLTWPRTVKVVCNQISLLDHKSKKSLKCQATSYQVRPLLKLNEWFSLPTCASEKPDSAGSSWKQPNEEIKLYKARHNFQCLSDAYSCGIHTRQVKAQYYSVSDIHRSRSLLARAREDHLKLTYFRAMDKGCLKNCTNISVPHIEASKRAVTIRISPFRLTSRWRPLE